MSPYAPGMLHTPPRCPTLPPHTHYPPMCPHTAPGCPILPQPPSCSPPPGAAGSCSGKQPPPGPPSLPKLHPTCTGPVVPWHGAASCSQAGKLRHRGTSQPDGHPLPASVSLPGEELHHPPPPKSCTAAISESLSSTTRPQLALPLDFAEKNLYFLRFISPQRPLHCDSVALQPPRTGTSASIPCPRWDQRANP